MKSIFTKYITAFDCPDSMQETINRIMSIVADRRNNLKVIYARYTGNQEILLHSKCESILFRSGTLPVISIEISELNKGSRVTMMFSLKKYEKIFACVIYSALILFQLFLILFFSRQSLSSVITSPIYIPALFILLFYFFTMMGLESASQKILRVFYESIMQSNAVQLPLLKRC